MCGKYFGVEEDRIPIAEGTEDVDGVLRSTSVDNAGEKIRALVDSVASNNAAEGMCDHDRSLV